MEHGPQKVYVIKHELGLYKIGIGQDPESRLRELQVGSPFELSIIQTENPTNAEYAERYLHDRFRKFHFRGEWFDLPDEQVPITIPTHVTPSGVPNKKGELVTDRDINQEWVRTFKRVVTAFNNGPKHDSKGLSHLKEEWRVYLEDDTDARERVKTPTIQERMEEADPTQVVCARCGYQYNHSESNCPMCEADRRADRNNLR